MSLWHAMALRRLRRFPEALAVLKSIERHPYLREQALWLKALVLEKLGRSPEALVLYRELVRAHDRNPVVRAAEARLQALTPPVSDRAIEVVRD